MSFDLQAFLNTQISLREKIVPVPGLAHWFPEGETPIFTVRALSGEEIFRAADAETRDRKIIAAVEALAGSVQANQFADAFRQAMGGDDIPEEMRRRIEHLLAGVIDPKLDRPSVLRLIAFYPTVAADLHKEIMILIAEGPILGKAPDSTPTPESLPA